MDLTRIIVAIDNANNSDWFISILTILVPAIMTIISMYYVNKNTNRQIANQNKETYRPRLKLLCVEEIPNNFEQNTLYAYSENYKNDLASEISISFDMSLKNIGHGLANDISFYMLNNGKECCGIQEDDTEGNQMLDSTVEIPVNGIEKIRFSVNFNKNFIDFENDYPNNEDYVLIICNYNDLNGNSYRLLIGIIVKKIKENDIHNYNETYEHKNNFNYYYYQEGTESYNGMIHMEKYEKHYNEILKYIKKSNNKT